MLKFDHLRIPVTNVARSRDWYVRTLGMKVETIFWDERSMKEK